MANLGELKKNAEQQALNQYQEQNPQMQVGQQKDGEQVNGIDRLKIKGILEDLTLETISKTIKKRFEEITGKKVADSKTGRALNSLVDVDNVMNIAEFDSYDKIDKVEGYDRITDTSITF